MWEQVNRDKVAYFVDQGILMREWSPSSDDTSDCNNVKQIVIPVCYRQQILSLAHESQWSGHLGITKTYRLLLQHFFWPGLKQDVPRFCCSCHICQVTGKPNQTIPPAPLHPIPVTEPFDHVIVDCVGPLPKSKSGNQYLLTIMCAATKCPEAVPLRQIIANHVLKALTKFFSTFGLLKLPSFRRIRAQIFSRDSLKRWLNIKCPTRRVKHKQVSGHVGVVASDIKVHAA